MLNITEEGMYVLKPDARGSSFRSKNSSVVKVKGTSLTGELKPDLVDLCGRVRLLMRDGNLRAFYPNVLDGFSELPEKGSDSDLDWEETSEEETEEETPKADKIIHVKVNEIETVVTHPRFPCDLLCSICQTEPCSSFRPYSSRSREIRENVERWINTELSESQADKWSKYSQIGQNDKETLRSALRVAARAEETMLRKLTVCERCEAEAEAHITDVDLNDNTLSVFRTRIGIPGFTRYVSTYLTKQRHVIRSKASKRVFKSHISQFDQSTALCYPSWLREQFGRLESELNLVRNFVGKKIEDLEDLKSKYMIPDNLFERKVAEFEMHCKWNFPCQRRLEEDSSAQRKRRAARMKSKSLKKAVERLGITSSSSSDKKVKEQDEIHISEAEKVSIEYQEDYGEYLLTRRELLKRGWMRLCEDHAMILVNAMQKYKMIRILHTDKDEFVQITPLNPEEIRQGLFGDKASDVFDKVSEIFPDVKKAFANKTFAKVCDKLRSDIFARHLQSLHLNDMSWIQTIGEAFRFLLVRSGDEDECLATIYKRNARAAITRLDVRQAFRSREEQTTTTVTLRNFGGKTEDSSVGEKKNGEENGKQKDTDSGTKSMSTRFHYESFEVQLKANHVTQNVCS